MSVGQPDDLLVFKQSSGSSITNYGTRGAAWTILAGTENTHYTWNPAASPPHLDVATKTGSNLPRIETSGTTPPASLVNINVALGFRVDSIDGTVNYSGLVIEESYGVSVRAVPPSASGDFDLTVRFRDNGDFGSTYRVAGLTFGTWYRFSASIDVATPSSCVVRYKLGSNAAQSATEGHSGLTWGANLPEMNHADGFNIYGGLDGGYEFLAYQRNGTAWSATDLGDIINDPAATITGWPSGGGGGDVTASLTGQGLTSAAGTASPATSKALSGQALSGAQTAPTPNISIALTGQAASFGQGSLAPQSQVALSGSTLAGAQGNVTAVTGVTVALTGQAMSLAQGSLTGDLTALLAGSQIAVTQGSVRVPAAPVAESATGGFMLAFEREMALRRRRMREIEEAEEAARELQDETDREIAILLQKAERENEQAAELNRLRQLVQDAEASRVAQEVTDRAREALVRAQAKESVSAYLALDRELRRMLEEEEFILLALLA